MLARVSMLLLNVLLVLAALAVFWQAWATRQMRLELDQTIQELRSGQSLNGQPAISPDDVDTAIAMPDRLRIEAPAHAGDANHPENHL